MDYGSWPNIAQLQRPVILGNDHFENDNDAADVEVDHDDISTQ